MTDLISNLKKDLFTLVDNLENKGVINNFNKDKISIDHSSKSKKGDVSSNIFLIISKQNSDNSFPLKDFIFDFFSKIDYIENYEITKVGFLNIFIKKEFLFFHIKNFYKNKKIDHIKQNLIKKINIEFVSANPTGPIHIAHIRGAVLGDVMSSILKKSGHNVTKEYYVNDAGSQIKVLTSSLFKRYQQLFNIDSVLEPDEYPGLYLIEVAKKIKHLDADKWLDFDNQDIRNSYFKDFALKFLIDEIKKDLSLININFDNFIFESDIVSKNFIDKVFLILKDKNLIYEGLLNKPLGDDQGEWEPRTQLLYRSSNFSDSSDRSFKKSNGEWTYFANDTAYHFDKYKRGFDLLINIWGADHIGYVSRMKSIVDSFSNKINYLDIYICQIVRLLKDGKILKMSKREGNFVTLKSIYKEVGKDPLRYFMISSKNDTPMDFDMNKVIEKNKDNPVFYCQYAYARASSVLRKANEFKNIPQIDKSLNHFNLNTLSQYESDLILKILIWPYIFNQSAVSKQPHRITNYLEELCSLFHSFWNRGKDDVSLRMIDLNNMDSTITKLIWLTFFKSTLKDIFDIIGINAPETM